MSDFAEQEHLALSDEGLVVVQATGQRLGHVSRPETSYRVPSEWDHEFNALLIEWEDAEAFGAACRAQVEWEYDTSRGVG